MFALPFQLPKKNRLQTYAPVLVWAALIFLLSSQPVLPGPDSLIWDFAFKKLAHMFVYFVFFRLMFQAVEYDLKDKMRASILALILSIIFSITDEYHQSFVPGRMPTVKDVLFDILGMLIAWLSIFKYV